MTDSASDPTPSRAVDRALTILEELATADQPMTLTKVAHQAGIPIATCAAMLKTLEHRGYAAREIVGRSHFWRATTKLSGLAAAIMRKTDLAEIAQPYLRRLVEQEGFAAHIGVLQGPSVVYAAKAAARGMVQFNTYRGKTAPFHLTALGRAIAAHLPDAELEPLLVDLKSGTGPHAQPLDSTAMRRLLAATRSQGYAIEDEEEDLGIGCLAAPLFGARGEVLASIGVTGIADHFRGRKVRTVRELVCEQARLLTNELSRGGHEAAGSGRA